MAKSKLAPPKGLTAYSAEDAANAWARVLLVGPAKSGKSTAVATTAPGPVLVINGDGNDSLQHASVANADNWHAVNVSNSREWLAACKWARGLAEDEKVRTISVDTFTLLTQNIQRELKGQGMDGFALWNTLVDVMMTGMNLLLDAQAHLFVVCHYFFENDAVGLIPAVSTNELRRYMPAKFSEWIWFDVDTTRKGGDKDPVRAFQIGPSGAWKGACRRGGASSQRISADVGLLFKTLGIQE